MADTSKILCIDDEPSLQRTYVRSLNRVPGVEGVDVASNGQEGLERLQQEVYGLVLVDKSMPVMDGVAFLRAVASDPVTYAKAPPQIMLSSEASSELYAAVTEAGATGLLMKPSLGNFLCRVVEQMLAGRRSELLEVNHQLQGYVPSDKVTIKKVYDAVRAAAIASTVEAMHKNIQGLKTLGAYSIPGVLDILKKNRDSLEGPCRDAVLREGLPRMMTELDPLLFPEMLQREADPSDAYQKRIEEVFGL